MHILVRFSRPCHNIVYVDALTDWWSGKERLSYNGDKVFRKHLGEKNYDVLVDANRGRYFMFRFRYLCVEERVL